ncbi:MAG: hypothetical protein R3243_16530 [Arenibacter latericius]|nr:hypothetical protein [Arenibacter latericius]
MNLRGHILSFFSILMVALFALPGALKAKHAILEHHNFVCKEKGKLHYHEMEVECEFYKYNISHFITPEYVELNNNSWIFKTEKVTDYYQYLSKYQKLHFSERGPPTLA